MGGPLADGPHELGDSAPRCGAPETMDRITEAVKFGKKNCVGRWADTVGCKGG